MNFGDWELFKLVLNGMRDDEKSHPAQRQPQYRRQEQLSGSGENHDNSRDTRQSRTSGSRNFFRMFQVVQKIGDQYQTLTTIEQDPVTIRTL